METLSEIRFKKENIILTLKKRIKECESWKLDPDQCFLGDNGDGIAISLNEARLILYLLRNSYP